MEAWSRDENNPSWDQGNLAVCSVRSDAFTDWLSAYTKLAPPAPSTPNAAATYNVQYLHVFHFDCNALHNKTFSTLYKTLIITICDFHLTISLSK